MSTSWNIKTYPAYFRDVMEKRDSELPLVVKMESKKVAYRQRMLWYGFRRAAERVAEGDPELRALLDTSARIAVRVEEDPFEGAALIFENRLSEADKKAWFEALYVNQPPKSEEPFLPPLKPEDLNLGESKLENVFEQLGYRPKPPGTEGEKSGS